MTALEALLKKTEKHPLLPSHFKTFVEMDLTANNQALTPPSLDNFERYQQSLITKYAADFSVGRYDEKRTIYQSDLFLGDNVRDIHLGIDINVPVATPILAPLPGDIHSFANNQADGDYGPTIIVKHVLDSHRFYCLYGHLSVEDLSCAYIGQPLKAGDIIGHTGAPSVNGNWPSHCHFQLIKDIGDYQGDYPGVCSTRDATSFLTNSPDPSVFLDSFEKVG